MGRFKEGDMITCVDSDESSLVCGRLYEVCLDSILYLEVVGTLGKWKSSRFVLAKPAFKGNIK